MSDDNYVSPYGFGVITDFVLDAICDRTGVDRNDFAEALGNLPEDARERLEQYIDGSWWQHYMGVAIDKLQDELSEYIDMEGLSE